MQTHLPVASKLYTIPLCTSSLTCIKQESSKGKLQKYGKLRQSKLRSLWNNSVPGVGCFCIKSFSVGGGGGEYQFSHHLKCFAPELENAVSPIYSFWNNDKKLGSLWWHGYKTYLVTSNQQYSLTILLIRSHQYMGCRGAGRNAPTWEKYKVGGMDTKEKTWIKGNQHEMNLDFSVCFSYSWDYMQLCHWQSIPDAS